MALATKCPYCSTIFRVASDQLKLRGGIVRCGHCSEAFDGHAGLIDSATARPVPLAKTARPAPAEPAMEPPLHYLAAPDSAPAQDQTDHQTEQQADQQAEHQSELQPEPEFDLDLDVDIDAEPALQSAIEPASDFLSTPAPERHWIDMAALTAADEARLQREARLTAASAAPAPLPKTESNVQVDAEIKSEIESETSYWAETVARYQAQAQAESEIEIESDTEAEAGAQIRAAAEADIRADIRPAIRPEARYRSKIGAVNGLDSTEPEFIMQSRRKQRHGKALTIVTTLGALLLLLALLAQGVMTFGSQLAAQAPQLKPALTRICSILGCRIALPMQIKAIAIELGQLQTLNAGTFSYATVLHNNSSTVQAWPHIELILTDGADQPVLRRVFTPRDYLEAQLDANPGFAARSEQALKLYFELTRINASGYHIAVFYP
jgi:predicted Zn finger-like uncharacterized protein